jgi:hypothetical protein
MRSRQTKQTNYPKNSKKNPNVNHLVIKIMFTGAVDGFIVLLGVEHVV